MILRRIDRNGGFTAIPAAIREKDRVRAHWRASKALAITVLAIFSVGAVLLPSASQAFGDSRLFGIPAATLLVSVAVPAVSLLLVFAFAASQDAIDRAYRLSERD